MVARTAKGTNSTKASGTSITISSVSANEGEALLVAVAGKGVTFPSVSWGSRDLARTFRRANTTDNFTVSCWAARRLKNTATRDIVATWPGSIDAKCILAITLDLPHVKDEIAHNPQADTGSPSSSATAALSVVDVFAWGAMVSEGPSSDTVPTLDDSFSTGQRVGTTGTPPVSNLTMVEGFKIITGDNSTLTLSGSGATQRDWVSGIAAYREIVTCAWDNDGSEVIIGDFVEYEGVEREVIDTMFQRNTIELSVVGLVEATQTRVTR